MSVGRSASVIWDSPLAESKRSCFRCEAVPGRLGDCQKPSGGTARRGTSVTLTERRTRTNCRTCWFVRNAAEHLGNEFPSKSGTWSCESLPGDLNYSLRRRAPISMHGTDYRRGARILKFHRYLASLPNVTRSRATRPRPARLIRISSRCGRTPTRTSLSSSKPKPNTRSCDSGRRHRGENGRWPAPSHAAELSRQVPAIFEVTDLLFALSLSGCKSLLIL